MLSPYNERQGFLFGVFLVRNSEIVDPIWLSSLSVIT